MEAKSPTMSLKLREMIGVDQFSQRREVFDKHDTVFLPPASPTNLVPAYKEVEPIITSNHGKTTSNFKRNTPGYSSMRESRTDEHEFELFRPRKYSDNFTSDLNQSDDVEYRHTMTDRTRRLSKLRRDFMTSNLHEPSPISSFNRSGTRASMPVTSSPLKYKIESPNLYKFPFAEPYTTPTPVRRVVVDLGPLEVDAVEGHREPDRTRHLSLTNNNESPTKIDQQKLFEQLLKRYSPQRKPVDWQLPPTKPRVVASVPKSSSSVADSIDSGDKKINDDKTEDDVFEKKEDVQPVPIVLSENCVENHTEEPKTNTQKESEEIKEIVENGVDSPSAVDASNEEDSKISQTEMEEKQDQVPELSNIQRQISKESAKKPPVDRVVDLSIPALIQKMATEGDNMENNKKPTKVKRKRSFLDKLLGRKKDK